MKVLMLIHSFYPHIGGAERQLLAQIPYFIEQGIDLTIITRQEPNTATSEIIQNTKIIRTKISKSKLLNALCYIKTALVWIKQNQPDFIHSYDLISTTTAAYLANHLFRIPYAIKILNSGSGSDIKRLKRKSFGTKRFNAIKKTCSVFFGISNTIIQELEDENINPKKIIKIYNGIDSQYFKPISTQEKKRLKAQLGISASFVACYTGRFVSNKNIIDSVIAWQYFSKKHTDSVLLIVGEGPQQQKLQQYQSNHIKILPKTNDVLPYLQIADCFLLASDHEGISNSLLEAMSVQVIPIVSNVVGNNELITHKKNGLLFELHNHDQIIKNINFLCQNPLAREELKQNARATIQSDYDIQSLVEMIIEQYHKRKYE